MNLTFVRDDEKRFYIDGSFLGFAAWGITEIDGLGTIEYEISTEKKAVGDGDIITGCRIPSRSIDITATVKNKENNATERRNALSFFNPKHNFILLVKRSDTTKWIATQVERMKCPDQSVTQNIKIELALKCVDPHFYSKDNFGKNIAAVTPGFGFPFISQIGKGFYTGVYNFARKVWVENTGDVETYFKIHIEAFGKVLNPKIMKDNTYIRIIDEIHNRDVIDIDLVENVIQKNGSNCIGKVDRTSSFSEMTMSVGDNVISFGADEGDANMRVTIYYNLRYLGA